MNADVLEFAVAVVGALVIVGVVIEVWNLLEHRREDRDDEHQRQILRQRYGRRP